jgi:hypothetical protein
VSRTLKRTAIAASVLLAVTFTAGLAAARADATSSLRGRLETAQRELKQANQRLAAAQQALDEVLTSQITPVVVDGASERVSSAVRSATGLAAPAAAESADVKALRARVTKARKQVNLWKKKVRELAAQVEEEEQIAGWERERDWMPIMKIAAQRFNVRAEGLYRMMMRESGGDPRAGASGQFRGLFQYWTGTWKNDWNPYRAESIFDGSAQIFATAYAIHKGMGPQMWTTTFASQY